jgi:hypothetical protein
VLSMRLPHARQRFLPEPLSDVPPTETPLDFAKVHQRAVGNRCMSGGCGDLQAFIGVSLRGHKITFFKVELCEMA